MLSSTTTGSEESNYNSSSWSSTQATPRRTMEEVWKDISLASLSDHNAAPNRLNNNPHFRNMALQDFLAQPFGNVVSPAPDHHHHHHDHPTLTSSPNPNPAATTVLSLNHLGSDQFQFFCIENLNNRPNTHSVSDHSFSGASPFEALGNHSSPSSGLVMPPAFGADNMRFPEFDHRNFGEGGGGGGGDRRHKRMIKNRESAARSRARKQESFRL